MPIITLADADIDGEASEEGMDVGESGILFLTFGAQPAPDSEDPGETAHCKETDGERRIHSTKVSC